MHPCTPQKLCSVVKAASSVQYPFLEGGVGVGQHFNGGEITALRKI